MTGGRVLALLEEIRSELDRLQWEEPAERERRSIRLDRFLREGLEAYRNPALDDDATVAALAQELRVARFSLGQAKQLEADLRASHRSDRLCDAMALRRVRQLVDKRRKTLRMDDLVRALDHEEILAQIPGPEATP